MRMNNYLLTLFGTVEDDCNVLGTSFTSLLNELFDIIKIVIPILLLVLIILDFVKAISANDEKAMKDAQSSAVKRIIIGVVIFFIPLLLDIILRVAGLLSGTCGIG